MPEKRFEDVRGLDPLIRDAIIEDLDGDEPDNFIESAEGGSVNIEDQAKETPEQREAMSKALNQRLRGVSPEAWDEERQDLRWG